MSKASLNDVKQLLKALQPPISRKTAESLTAVRKEVGAAPSFTASSLNDASASLPVRQVKAKSNLLLFRTRNQLLHKSDFTKLLGSSPLASELTMKAFQARNKDTMLPKGGYFLLFDSHQHASAYLLETLGKTINGVNFYLEMCNPEEKLHMLQTQFDESFNIDSTSHTFNVTYIERTPRSHYVLVSGFPSFIKAETLKTMLWEYELDTSEDPVGKTDKAAGISTWLIKFTNALDPQRFVRRYNGKHFENDPRLPKVYASQMN